MNDKISGLSLVNGISYFNEAGLLYRELISKTSYIHSYILLICSSGHSKEATTKNLLQMENIDTYWNLE